MHRREHSSVLAAAEKRLLTAIARRLPPQVTSDQLTLLSLASMLLAAAACAAIPYARFAPAVFVVALAGNWFGDSLDGTLARVRRQERPRYGFYVDHVIDLAGAAALMGGLAVSGLMNPLVAASVLIAYLLVCAESFLATHAGGVFRLAFAGIGPTELRIVLAVGVFRAAAHPDVTNAIVGRLRLLDLGGAVAVVGLLTAFVVSAIGQTRALHAAEPLDAGRRDAA